MTFLVVKQSHVRVTSKKKKKLFTVHHIVSFPISVVFFHEALLLLRYLIDLVHGYL